MLNGKVIIGHGGADVSTLRGYVTTYDAETGKLLWRFHIVPGDPALGSENKAMEVAARTWSGEWWKNGGAGAAWNTMTCDKEPNLIYNVTGKGSSWTDTIPSNGRGDNTFHDTVVEIEI